MLHRVYQATREIKRGHAHLDGVLAKLADWIGRQWQVTVLNVVYTRPNKHRDAQLVIVVEHAADELSFIRGDEFDSAKQQAIVDQWRQLAAADQGPRLAAGVVRVTFVAFVPWALQQVDEQITEAQIKQLQRDIDDPELWAIARCPGRVTFLFYTDAQMVAHKALGCEREYANRYFELLRPYDEFGYLVPDQWVVDLDSKQNLDQNYQGSWFQYYR